MARPSRSSSGGAALLLLAGALAPPAAGAAELQLVPADQFPPAHLRAVENPPDRWSKVFAARRELRLFWNGGASYDVQRLTEDGWQTISTGAGSGWTSQRLARGTELRLVGPEGASSEPLTADTVVSPLSIARLAGEPGALLGAQVVDIGLDGSANPWTASLGGGVARVERDGLQSLNLGLSEGLPSERVVAVAPTDSGAWVGTAAGLVHVGVDVQDRRSMAFQVSDVIGVPEGLPDAYVQALATEPGIVWVGTYRGLARLDHGGLDTVLQPWSVFSLVRGSDERIWVGYEGLLGLPEAEPIEGIDTELDVYDVEPLPRTGTLLATLQQGVVLLSEGETRPVWRGSASEGAYALARVSGFYLAAGASAGMVSLAPSHGVLRRWGLEDGLPSTVVNEVVPDLPWTEDPAARMAVNARAAWLGTEAGLAWLDPVLEQQRVAPSSRLPAGVSWTHVSRRGSRRHLVGPQGLAFLGPELPRDGQRVERIGTEAREVLRQGSTWWVLREDRVEQLPLVGRDRHHHVPGPLRAAVLVNGVPWVGGEQGLFRYDPSERQFQRVAGVGPVSALRAGEGGSVWAIASDVVLHVERDFSLRPYIGTHRPLDLAPAGGIIWVGTDNGIDMIHAQSGEVMDLLRTADRKVAVPAVAADGQGGCWAGTDAGQVLHLDTGLLGGASVFDLTSVEPPTVLAIEALDDQRVWVLSDQGVFAVWRPRTPGP